MKEIVISSEISNISKVELFIDQLTKELNITDPLYGYIMVSVVEAFTNAVVHGNKNDSSKKITIKADKDNSFLIFSIADEGNGFDYDNLPDPTSPENIENLTGRGVFLMRKLADKVEFFQDGRIVSLNFNYL
jgi:serine/threonine-protein kinase RsbW